MKNARFLLSISLLALLASGPTSLAQAPNPNWNNTGTDFNSAASWGNGSSIPTSIANFNAAAVTQPNLSGNLSIQRVAYSAAAPGYNLTANNGVTLSLANATPIDHRAENGFNVISAPLAFSTGANTTATIINTRTGTFTSVLALTGPISTPNTNVTVARGAGGILFLEGANTFSGPFRITATEGGGETVINSIGNTGAGPSSLGAPTAGNGTIVIASGDAFTQVRAEMRYTGGTSATDRDLVLNLTGATNLPHAFTLRASGSGALTWNGDFSVSGANANNKNLWLTGVSGAGNTFGGNILDEGAGGVTRLVKNGTGSWTVTGANTFTGGLHVNGGTLTVDYNQGASLNSANNILFGQANGAETAYALTVIPNSGGNLRLLANATGVTSQTLGNLSTLFGQNKLQLDPNGGSGITLTVGNTWTITPGSQLIVDLPTGATLTSAPSITTGIISAGAVLVNDSSGIGFGTVSGGDVVRFTGASTLTASSNGFGANWEHSGDLTMNAGPHDLYTLDINTTGGGTLNLNGTTIGTLSVLFSGTDDYTVSNGTIGLSGGTFHLHQHSTGLVTLPTVNTGTTTLNKGGAGTVAIATRGSSGIMRILDGAIRANGSTVYSAGAIQLSTGGVLELGSAGNFTGALGTAAGQIQWLGDGGFSAHGAERTVQIGGNTNTIAWGATNFVPNDNALVLSNVQSDNTIDFQNGLNFGTAQRVVRVNNGSAAVDATLSGTLSSSYGGGLIKEGAGTLSVTGNNTYIGQTWVNAGTLLVNNTSGSGTGTGSVTVFAGATLGGSGTISGGVSVSGILAPGNSIDTLNTGSLSITSTGVLDIELGRSGGTPVSDRTNVTGTVDIASGADLHLTLYTGLDNPLVNDIFFLISNDGVDSITGFFTKLNGVNTDLSEGSLFNWNSQQWQITYTADFDSTSFTGGNDLALQVVPEPSTWLLFAISGTALVVFRRRRIGFVNKC